MAEEERLLVWGAVRLAGVVACLSLPLLPWRRLIILARTLRRDLEHLYAVTQAKRMAKRLIRPDNNVGLELEQRARNFPGEVIFLFEDEKWTRKDVNEFANRVARVLQGLGVVKGDAVALMLDNRVEYVCTWLGVAKLGAVTALVNRNIVDASLLHSIRTAKCKAVIFGSNYAKAVGDVRHDLGEVHSFLQFDDDRSTEAQPWFRNLAPLLDAASADDPLVETPAHVFDPIVYMYTSGTSGLPKAVVITHARFMYWAAGLTAMLGVKGGRDTIYCVLPLYHAAGGGHVAALAVLCGVTVAYTPRFSARKYWADCIKHGANVGQYIGEVSRYLLLTPQSAADRRHPVRMMFGNGMAPALWPDFVQRFGIRKVVEVYGCTEGNGVLANWSGQVGAVGFVPRCLPRSMWPVDFLKVDEETSELIRDAATGWCIRCEDGEHGMVAGRIRDDARLTWPSPYLEDEATEKKILRNAFTAGDKHFLFGDLVVVDELGFVYFKDRVGDTYRWKAENVSTTEVEDIVSKVLHPLGVREVAVYGVEVPGHEGRAGMVAIADPDGRTDLQLLAQQLTKRLPAYARPVFARVMQALPMTGTHKVSKYMLKNEGFAAVPDASRVYVYDSRTANYEPLTDALLADIRENRLRI